MMAEMYENLKQHLDRNFIIKKTMKERREEVMNSDDKAYIHMDWAENIEIAEIQSAFFAHLSVSIHTGYLYCKQDSGGFVSLSDENNNKAEGIHAEQISNLLLRYLLVMVSITLSVSVIVLLHSLEITRIST